MAAPLSTAEVYCHFRSMALRCALSQRHFAAKKLIIACKEQRGRLGCAVIELSSLAKVQHLMKVKQWNTDQPNIKEIKKPVFLHIFVWVSSLSAEIASLGSFLLLSRWLYAVSGLSASKVDDADSTKYCCVYFNYFSGIAFGEAANCITNASSHMCHVSRASQ